VTFDYRQWRTATAVTPEMLDSCLDRVAELQAELAALKSELAKYRSVVPESLRRWAAREEA